jgi:hypothetical protein
MLFTSIPKINPSQVNDASEKAAGRAAVSTFPAEPPRVEISDSFHGAIFHIIPWRPDEPATDDEVSNGWEPIFRQWLNLVKRHYPDESRTHWNWLAAAWVLFLEFGNIIYQSGISKTEYRVTVFNWMVERFGQAFQTLGGVDAVLD